MSYDIYIGNGEVEALGDEDAAEFYVNVKRIELAEAPTFPNDDMTGNGNSRHPGYSQWTEFCCAVGLYDLFFDKQEGLMRQHPGTFALAPSHLDRVRTALDRHRAKWPGVTPGFRNPLYPTKDTPIDDSPEAYAAGQLARLIWLEFWIAWALKTCEHPAIHNM